MFNDVLNNMFYMGVLKVCKLHIRNVHTSHVTKGAILMSQNVFSKENKSIVQKKLSTPHYSEIRKIKLSDNPSYAAVVIPMCIVNGKPSLLYMQRSNLTPAHRGEICFPGGMMEKADEDLVHTGIRETYEEIGLKIKRDNIWGTMRPVPSSRYREVLVTPVIAECGELDIQDLKLSTKEVQNVFTRSIASLCDAQNVGSTQFRGGESGDNVKSGYTLPVFLGEKRIWGLTAVLTHMFLTTLAPDLYKFKIRHKS